MTRPGSNPQPPGHKVDALPLSHYAGNPVWTNSLDPEQNEDSDKIRHWMSLT